MADQDESAVERGGVPEEYREVADESDYRIPPGCPHCDKSARAYYLGDVGMTENNVFVTGWVCVACETPISLYSKGKGGDFVDERPDLDCLDNIETPRDDDTEQSELVTDGGTPEMKSIECPNCGMPFAVPEEADHWSCDCGASWELDPRADGGHDLGAECDVDECESRVVGLGDGWEVSRGTVCQDCIDYRDRHAHWPDEDPEICVECRLDDGAIRHECDEAAVDAVILNRDSTCDYCGFEANVATDGGRDIDFDEPPEIPDPPMYPEWEGVETWSKANLRYPVPGGWEIADHGKFHTTWEHEDGTELTRSSKRTPGTKDTFTFSVDGEEVHSVDTGPQRVEMREETVWLLQFYDENDIDSVEEFEVAVRKQRNQSLDEFATDGGVDQSEAAVERIDKLDDLEISVHHTVRLQHRTHRWEYEVHAGMADVLEIPKPLAEMAKTVIGVDLERDNIESAAEIRVIEDA